MYGIERAFCQRCQKFLHVPLTLFPKKIDSEEIEENGLRLCMPQFLLQFLNLTAQCRRLIHSRDRRLLQRQRRADPLRRRLRTCGTLCAACFGLRPRPRRRSLNASCAFTCSPKITCARGLSNGGISAPSSRLMVAGAARCSRRFPV
jgi:hypothetical protein